MAAARDLTQDLITQQSRPQKDPEIPRSPSTTTDQDLATTGHLPNAGTRRSRHNVLSIITSRGDTEDVAGAVSPRPYLLNDMPSVADTKPIHREPDTMPAYNCTCASIDLSGSGCEAAGEGHEDGQLHQKTM